MPQVCGMRHGFIVAKNPGVNLDVNGQICYQVGAYTQVSGGNLYPLDLPGANDTSCNYPFQALET
jgi:hypothetical protein